MLSKLTASLKINTAVEFVGAGGMDVPVLYLMPCGRRTKMGDGPEHPSDL